MVPVIIRRRLRGTALHRAVYQRRWRRTMRRQCPQAMQPPEAAASLRLILGTARSGTSWLVETLARSQEPMRCLIEPLYKLRPKLLFSFEADRTALPYASHLPAAHPLLMAYRLAASGRVRMAELGVHKGLRRDDADASVCLVKEVHSLLATEALLKALPVPVIFVVRDPVFVCDSLFDRDGLESIYGVIEARHVTASRFVRRFVPDHAAALKEEHARIAQRKDPRMRTITERVLTVALIHAMFRQLAREHHSAHIVSYEKLCRVPYVTFQEVAATLGIAWDARAASFLDATMAETEESSDPHSVFRETDEQVERPLRFLKPKEAAQCREMLERTGLC